MESEIIRFSSNHFWVPKYDLEVGPKIREYDLNTILDRPTRETMSIVHIAAGVEEEILRRYDSPIFIEVLYGSPILEWTNFENRDRVFGQAGRFYRIPRGQVIVSERDGSPVCFVMMSSQIGGPYDGGVPEIKQWSLENTPTEHDERPEPLRTHVLKSLWKQTDLIQTVGYERVWINGLVRKHRHQATRPDEVGSDAIIIVVGGEGQIGIQPEGDNPKVYTTVDSPNFSIFTAKSTDWHGLAGRQLEIVAIQIPELGEKYQFAPPEEEFAYDPKYL